MDNHNYYPLLFHPQPNNITSSLDDRIPNNTVSNNQVFGNLYGNTSRKEYANDHEASPSQSITNGEMSADDDKAMKKKEKKARRHRYAFQTRSQVDILDDGYRWRKYGQKAVKNNKFPRSYYRCTHQGCNVKKQVQRLSKDEGVVVTTYEGMHTHPIEKSNDNFEHILNQMQIFSGFN